MPRGQGFLHGAVYRPRRAGGSGARRDTWPRFAMRSASDEVRTAKYLRVIPDRLVWRRHRRRTRIRTQLPVALEEGASVARSGPFSLPRSR